MNPVIQYWYFHLPNFVLAAVMYTLIGRLLLSFFVPAGWQNYIWRAFVRITEPVVGAVRLLTPAALPTVVVIIFSVFWIMLLRLALIALLGSLGLLPDVSGPSGG
ncbi:YggT family protein [Taklimakanibacter deserti]|uniref:YggT family protein n=1 Tax=Taklimakanibacter deserti TaxID=2267839 RepID=UPI000E64CDE1